MERDRERERGRERWRENKVPPSQTPPARVTETAPVLAKGTCNSSVRGVVAIEGETPRAPRPGRCRGEEPTCYLQAPGSRQTPPHPRPPPRMVSGGHLQICTGSSAGFVTRSELGSRDRVVGKERSRVCDGWMDWVTREGGCLEVEGPFHGTPFWGEAQLDAAGCVWPWVEQVFAACMSGFA